jgi:hypothetical protein
MLPLWLPGEAGFMEFRIQNIQPGYTAAAVLNRAAKKGIFLV